jgi:SAM-dependent methyltransferase
MPYTPVSPGAVPSAPTAATHLQRLAPFLADTATVYDDRGIPTVRSLVHTAGLDANAYYFGHPKWVKNWFECVHRYPELRQRWHAAAGTWDDKVVIDVGCGPGNLFATLGGSPRELIGVDVSRGSLEWAANIGYTPLLADAQDMPLKPGIADVVALCGTIHHTDDMALTLKESARLVKPGGLLVADHDPQKGAYDLRGMGMLLWKAREPLYRLIKRGGHSPEDDEQKWALATEIHHRAGDGVTEELLRSVLEPAGFDVQLYPHNHDVGEEAVHGQMGRAPLKMRVAQRLSGISPSSPEAALSLLCVARKRA